MLKFKAGDQSAFRRLFDRYKGRVIRYCYRFCGHPEVAEELAQETFIRVYKAAGRYRPKARFSTWLFRIATNVCLNEIRRPDYRLRFENVELPNRDAGREEKAMSTPESDNRPDACFARAEQHKMVLDAISQLPEDQRAALLLRVEEEFSYKEIGRQIGCSESSIKTLIFRGRRKLKQALAAYFGDTP